MPYKTLSTEDQIVNLLVRGVSEAKIAKRFDVGECEVRKVRDRYFAGLSKAARRTLVWSEHHHRWVTAATLTHAARAMARSKGPEWRPGTERDMHPKLSVPQSALAADVREASIEASRDEKPQKKPPRKPRPAVFLALWWAARLFVEPGSRSAWHATRKYRAARRVWEQELAADRLAMSYPAALCSEPVGGTRVTVPAVATAPIGSDFY